MRTAPIYFAALLALLAGCGSRSSAQPAAPASHVNQAQVPTPDRLRLLVIDPSKRSTPTWMMVDGKRVNVLPATAFTTARISAPVRATAAGALTGAVFIVPDSPLWATAGNQNTAVPVVGVIGQAESPVNWSRVPITITQIVLRNPDGSQRTIAAKGWLVDAEDEIGGVRCGLEQPDFSNGQHLEPTVHIPMGRRVVIMMSESVVL